MNNLFSGAESHLLGSTGTAKNKSTSLSTFSNDSKTNRNATLPSFPFDVTLAFLVNNECCDISKGVNIDAVMTQDASKPLIDANTKSQTVPIPDYVIQAANRQQLEQSEKEQEVFRKHQQDEWEKMMKEIDINQYNQENAEPYTQTYQGEYTPEPSYNSYPSQSNQFVTTSMPLTPSYPSNNSFQPHGYGDAEYIDRTSGQTHGYANEYYDGYIPPREDFQGEYDDTYDSYEPEPSYRNQHSNQNVHQPYYYDQPEPIYTHGHSYGHSIHGMYVPSETSYQQPVYDPYDSYEPYSYQNYPRSQVGSYTHVQSPLPPPPLSHYGRSSYSSYSSHAQSSYPQYQEYQQPPVLAIIEALSQNQFTTFAPPSAMTMSGQGIGQGTGGSNTGTSQGYSNPFLRQDFSIPLNGSFKEASNNSSNSANSEQVDPANEKPKKKLTEAQQQRIDFMQQCPPGQEEEANLLFNNAKKYEKAGMIVEWEGGPLIVYEQIAEWQHTKETDNYVKRVQKNYERPAVLIDFITGMIFKKKPFKATTILTRAIEDNREALQQEYADRPPPAPIVATRQIATDCFWEGFHQVAASLDPSSQQNAGSSSGSSGRMGAGRMGSAKMDFTTEGGTGTKSQEDGTEEQEVDRSFSLMNIANVGLGLLQSFFGGKSTPESSAPASTQIPDQKPSSSSSYSAIHPPSTVFSQPSSFTPSVPSYDDVIAQLRHESDLIESQQRDFDASYAASNVMGTVADSASRFSYRSFPVGVGPGPSIGPSPSPASIEVLPDIEQQHQSRHRPRKSDSRKNPSPQDHSSPGFKTPVTPDTDRSHSSELGLTTANEDANHTNSADGTPSALQNRRRYPTLSIQTNTGNHPTPTLIPTEIVHSQESLHSTISLDPLMRQSIEVTVNPHITLLGKRENEDKLPVHDKTLSTPPRVSQTPQMSDISSHLDPNHFSSPSTPPENLKLQDRKTEHHSASSNPIKHHGTQSASDSCTDGDGDMSN